MTIERRVEWPDTDAAGHYHHSTVIRWVEAAEAVLLERLGLAGLFGAIPRVRYEVDYLERLWFGDLATVGLTVAEVGRSSVRYEFVVTRGAVTAARGILVAVHTANGTDGAAAWPENVVRVLCSAGRVPGERLLATPDV
ncbi:MULTISPECIES: thioesterase family protein [unclassified Nocardia]|uniref:acyl-CoA thioesterase n=1 Tax=unclassified Nocardia TaxID=2637762 RepID=UPI001CE499E1|nr:MULTISPECIES: thioesterase family protein [unclassified Nocardia]